MQIIKSLKIIPICLVIISSFMACDETLQGWVTPSNGIISIYQSPKIDSYKIKSVSLIPMIPDDTTDTGTFYSTNHFINMLEKEYPAKKYAVANIDTAIANNSLAVSLVINSIEKKRRLDIERFTVTEFGYDVLKDSTDAMLIGIIDSCKKKNGNIITGYQYITSCNFVYYLISLKDGAVLWKARIRGEEGYTFDGVAEVYPPLYSAISNGIDVVLKMLPFR